MNINEIKKYAEQWLEENKQQFYDLSDFIWNNPELGLEEYGVFSAVTQLLKEHNFSIENEIGGMPTAFIATYGTEGPVIGINVEYDCLPGLSQEKANLFQDQL